jgi:antitoxin component YwqK of YwqJK toxin-antitoxin module
MSRDMSSDIYQFQNNKLLIIDEEMDLHYEEEYSPKMLPEDLIDGEDLGDGDSVVLAYHDKEKKYLREAYVSRDGMHSGQCCYYHLGRELKGNSFYQLSEDKKSSLLHGPVSYYSEDGSLFSQSWYIRGRQSGKSYMYYPSGVVYACLRYRNHIKEGCEEFYFEDGSPKTVLPYLKGELHGECRLYFQNGQLYRCISHQHGKKHGWEKEYNPSGRLAAERYSEDAALKYERYWNPRGVKVEERRYGDHPGKKDLLKWDALGKSRYKHLYNGDRFEHIEKNHAGGVTKKYYGFWDGESMVIDKFVRGVMNHEERLSLIGEEALPEGVTLPIFGADEEV